MRFKPRIEPHGDESFLRWLKRPGAIWPRGAVPAAPVPGRRAADFGREHGFFCDDLGWGFFCGWCRSEHEVVDDRRAVCPLFGTQLREG